jgi:hypothetical protein
MGGLQGSGRGPGRTGWAGGYGGQGGWTGCGRGTLRRHDDVPTYSQHGCNLFIRGEKQHTPEHRDGEKSRERPPLKNEAERVRSKGWYARSRKCMHKFLYEVTYGCMQVDTNHQMDNSADRVLMMLSAKPTAC